MIDDIEGVMTKIRTMEEMVPKLVYKKGDSFGDLSLLRGAPRAGTVVSLTNCHLAKIPAQSYEKLFKKSE